jgi:DNA helicase II / ATP-dependent DNA helicase PcrA
MFYLRDIKKNIDKLKQEAINPTQFQIVIEDQQTIYNEKLEELKTNKRIKDLEKRTVKDKETYDTHIGKLKELNLLYKTYQKYLRENELYDFNDMIQFVVEKFRSDESLRSYYAEKFLYIMLDEYQDTNNAQNEIIEHICSPFGKTGLEKERPVLNPPNIMVVGDDDQSIYRFQGANIENMLGFSVRQKDAKIIVLEDNYRSTQTILDTATSLISNNSERLV